MKLKYFKCIIEPKNDLNSGIKSTSFSPNGKKLAVATSDRHVLLFDETFQQKDKFLTKPIDSKFGKKNYSITCVCFSPDSTKLAVGQTDNIVYVYRLGESWNEKKVICNKFLQSAFVSKILWPAENKLIIGLNDGKVRNGLTSSNKCSTLYKADSTVVSLSPHPNSRSFASGHINGSIIVYSFQNRSQTKICVHSTPPYCLVFSNFSILASGADRRIVAYDSSHGRILQDFDYTSNEVNKKNINFNNQQINEKEKEFFVAVADSSGHNAIFGSFNRFRLMSYNIRRGAWNESGLLNLKNFFTATTVCWKPDGTTIVAGNCVGGLVVLDCCIKKTLLKNRYETTYVSPSQILFTDTKSKLFNNNLSDKNLSQTCVIRSTKNYSITNLRILNDQNNQKCFVIGHTAHTMIIADVQNNLCSEVSWDWSGNERFYFENENVCMIVNAGEISFVKYGQQNILGWILTERVNPSLISVRVKNLDTNNIDFDKRLCIKDDYNKKAIKKRLIDNLSNDLTVKLENNKIVCCVAYLIDVHTISVVNLITNNQIAYISHNNSIDWLELNELGNKILFRDVGHSLFLHCLKMNETKNLLNFCSYVQWVPQSDVIVAQNADMLCVWYKVNNCITSDITFSTEPICFPIQGDIEAVVRDENRTEVIVLENNARVAYELDNAMIEFDSALNNLNFSRAIIFLERCEEIQANYNYSNLKLDENIISYDLTPMWYRLANVALQNMELLIAQRCFVALKDFSKVRYISETIEQAELALQTLRNQNTDENNDNQFTNNFSTTTEIANYYEVRAQIALLNKDLKQAEKIYIENNSFEKAIEMHKKLNNWEAVIELAKTTNYVGLENLKEEYYTYLNNTNQREKAAEIKANEGDINYAIQLYLQSNRPAMAARLMLENFEKFCDNEKIVEDIVQALKQNELYDKCGELLEQAKRFDEAIDAFCQAKNFRKAICIARFTRPNDVVNLEKIWGDALFDEKNYDKAINHFLESGESEKAAESAIYAKEWSKAIEILDAFENSENKTEKILQFYIDIAHYFEAEAKYEKAEKFYVQANKVDEAIEMYNKAMHWSKAYKLAVEYYGADKSLKIYLEQADILIQNGHLSEAENLYISINEIGSAVAMYKKANRYNEMMRIIKKYHPEQVSDIHKRLAEELEEKADLKSAEEHYLAVGNWNAVVEMYKEAEQWADAFRVAKLDSANQAYKQVAYLWAKSLGGDMAVKLLTRHNVLHESINLAINKRDFEFAFNLCNFGAKSRLIDVQQKYAEYLEDEENFTKAEEFYLKAGQNNKAILMHIHNHNWDLAEKIANMHLPEMLNEIFVARAKVALDNKNLQEAETYLLRANRSDIILNYYQQIGEWNDALRIAEKYRPYELEQIKNEYEEVQLRSGAKGPQLFVVQAAEWERQGEYQRAVNCYLKIDETTTDDVEMITLSQKKAAELILKFLLNDQNDSNHNYENLLEQIGAKLINLRQFSSAADIYLMADMPKNAIEALIEAHDWTKAQRLAEEISDEMVEYFKENYHKFLKNQGCINELIDVDVISAIDVMIEQKQYDWALTTAKQQNDRNLLDKYLLVYITELLNKDCFLDAAKQFIKFGATINYQYFNIYKILIDRLVNQKETNYKTFAILRNVIFDLNQKIVEKKNDFDKRIIKVFERYEYVLHFYALHKALEPFSNNESNTNFDLNNDIDSTKKINFIEQNLCEIQKIRLKLIISMLRYIDLLRPDKVLYEAGNACREFGKDYEGLAFVLLNLFLDIADAIEENNLDFIDTSIFENTDIPQNFSIPSTLFIQKAEYENIKEWVLTASLSQTLEKKLKEDENRPNIFEASTIDANGNSFPICIVTGYPILGEVKKLSLSKTADSNSWKILNNLFNTQQSEDLFDVQDFLAKWLKN